MIAAMAANRVIGRQQAIPWHIPGEQQHFREVTWGHPLIMGRKTFAAIGRPLPGRRNIVVSRNPALVATGCEMVPSLDAALTLCVGSAKVFVIGGEQLFAQALPLTDTIILTTLPREVAGDTFFPPFEQEFSLVSSRQVSGPDPYCIHVYRRQGQGGKPIFDQQPE
jgi:dihydrofolate reductase